jgi:FOG: CBS domain
MIAKDIICNNFPVLQPNDNCEKAIDLMTEFNVAEIPIVQQGKYVGLLREELALELFDVPISEIKTMHEPVSVLEQTHIFEIIKVFVNSKLTLMPVVDGNANYIGTITIKELFQGFCGYQQSG